MRHRRNSTNLFPQRIAGIGSLRSRLSRIPNSIPIFDPAPEMETPEVATHPVDFDEVAPDASAMIESMRAYGYTLPSAIADLIDNSIAACATTVWLYFQWSGADSWITILDDGTGMMEGELRNAMRLGSRNPLQTRAKTDLGRFGMGLKTASLSQCRRLTVCSRAEGCEPAIRRWDLDHLSQNSVGGWQLLKSAFPGSESRACISPELHQGTLVLWEVLDRIVGNADTDDRRMHRHFQELVADVEAHLSMVFHRYLEGTRPKLKILINHRTIRAWDPFLEGHAATDSTPLEQIAVPGFSESVSFRGFVLPHKDRLGDRDHQAASGPAGWNAQQGFYLYRNDRLIIAGSWLGLGGARPWTKEEHYKLARIRLDIPNSMDHLWQLDVKKSSAQPPARIRDRLTALAHGVRGKARDVYAHRGKHGLRQRTLKFARPWRVVRDGGLVSYRIDREHPLVRATLSTASGAMARELEAMLQIIEGTVPVEQIWLDAADGSEQRARPLHGMASPQVRHLVEVSYTAIRRNRHLNHAEAVAALLCCEEFMGDEARAVIASLTPECDS